MQSSVVPALITQFVPAQTDSLEKLGSLKPFALEIEKNPLSRGSPVTLCA